MTTTISPAAVALPLLLPDWAAGSGIGACSTWRKGGVSTGDYADEQGEGGLNLGAHVGDQPLAVAENRRRLALLLPSEPVWLNQVHGCDVALHDMADSTDDRTDDSGHAARQPVSADAMVTRQPGAVCAVMTADCLPILLCDPQQRVVGALHAGWRGLAAGIVAQTIARMRTLGAQDIMAWLGPAIGPGCFEVGPEVRQAFLRAAQKYAGQHRRAHQHFPDPAVAATEAAFRPSLQRSAESDSDRLLADIYQLAKVVLQASGVHDISGGGLCTVSDPAFYSYRRDGVTGRMATAIWLGTPPGILAGRRKS